MLGLFRKYQKVFFFFITVIIVISFSFFGTYSTFTQTTIPKHPAFTAIDGEVIYDTDLDAMTHFIGFGQIGGMRNFLNDGVIEKDLMMGGLMPIFVERYRDVLKEEWRLRLEREKMFQLYHHPQAPFLGVEALWKQMSPGMVDHFQTLKESNDPFAPDALEARIQLYLGQINLPPQYLKQLIYYQGQQQSWVPADPAFPQADLSLYGYHTLSDWFGPQFLNYVSAMIINGAKVAEQKGYKVTRGEALASLLSQASQSFQQIRQNQRIQARNSDEFFRDQLKWMRMNREQAIEIWRQVLLFRRLISSEGVLVDRNSYEPFYHSMGEALVVDMFRLPPDLRLARFTDLQNFEIYQEAVVKKYDPNSLQVSENKWSAEELVKRYPELVRKKYRVEMAELDRNVLKSNISIKKTWAWELDEKNWERLQKTFPDLGISEANNRNARIAALDALDPVTRSRVDDFARDQILMERPDVIEDEIAKLPTNEVLLPLRYAGMTQELKGLQDAELLMEKLDRNDEITLLTGDDRHYYLIRVLERGSNPEVITYLEAKRDGTLNRLVEQRLRKHYEIIRDNNPLIYRDANGEWKEFGHVKTNVAKDYFKNVLASLRQLYFSRMGSASEEFITEDQLASWRLLPHLEKIKGKDDVWELLGSRTKLRKGDRILLGYDQAAVFTLDEGEWSGIAHSPNGDLSFFQVIEKKQGVSEVDLAKAMRAGQSLLQQEIQKETFQELLKDPIVIQKHEREF